MSGFGKDKMSQEKDIYFKILRKLESSTSLGALTALRGRDELEIESAKQITILTNALKRPLIFLRTFGNNPIQFRQAKYLNVDYILFENKRTSWLSLYSYTSQVFYISILCLIGLRLFRGEYHASEIPGSTRAWKAKHSTSMTDVLIKVFTATFFLSCCGGCVSSCCLSGKFVTFLNNWKPIVLQFSRTFRETTLNYHRMNCISMRSVFMTIVISFGFAIMAFFFYSPCLINSSGKCKWIEREHSFAFAFFGTATVLNTAFEYSKFFIVVYTVLTTFTQIKDAVSKTKESFSEDRLILRDLLTLVYKLRSQSKLLMRICETNQAFILFFLFVLTIILWMLLLQYTAGDVDFYIAVMLITIGFMQYVRFFVMSYICEKVQSEEKAIATEVSEIQPSTLRNQIELQIFVNVLTTKPTEFHLHNAIAFKRSLLLALLSNTTTYLIAILQLVDVSGLSPAISIPTTPTVPSFQELSNATNSNADLGSIEIVFN